MKAERVAANGKKNVRPKPKHRGAVQADEPDFRERSFDELVDYVAGVAMHELLKGVAFRSIIYNAVESATAWHNHQLTVQRRNRVA